MPLTDNDLSRLADMAHALRPQWDPRSVRAWLASNLRNRAAGDVAVALAVVAMRSEIKTPAVMASSGPWWGAPAPRVGGLSPRVGPEPGEPRCRKPGHEHESARSCRLCRAESLDAGTSPASERAFAPDDAEATKPIHAVLRATAREVLCGVPRNGGGVWMQL